MDFLFPSGGWKTWPTDLMPSDFPPWGYVKQRVFCIRMNEIDNLNEIMKYAICSVTPDILPRAKKLFRILLICAQNNKAKAHRSKLTFKLGELFFLV